MCCTIQLRWLTSYFQVRSIQDPRTIHQLRFATLACTCPRLAQVFDPSKAKDFTSDRLTKHLNELESLPCFSEFKRDLNLQSRSPLLEGMCSEIAQFRVALAGLDANAFDHDDPAAFTAAVLKWWRCRSRHIPHWATAARIMFAVSPSSAAAERVFSILANSFDSTRDHALEDLVEGTIQVRFNNKQRDKEGGGEDEGAEDPTLGPSAGQ